MFLQVATICGPVCVDPDDGIELCRQIDAALIAGEYVTLDFAGVNTLTTSFLNSAIGCLYRKRMADEVDERLDWTGLDETDESLIRLVQSNAVRFFAFSAADQTRLVDSERDLAGSR